MRRFWLFVLLLAGLVPAPALVAQEKEPRTVTVNILVDGTDIAPVAVGFLYDAFSGASKVFQKEFGVKFKVVGFNAGLWRSPSNDFDGNKELARITKLAFSKESDIVVAFTTKKFFGYGITDMDGAEVVAKKHYGGIAIVFGKHAIIHLEERSELILIHELGHIFGVGHSPDDNSVMNAEQINTFYFDEKSKEVILENRDRIF